MPHDHRLARRALLSLALLLAVSACSRDAATNSAETPTAAAAPAEPTEVAAAESSDPLVAQVARFGGSMQALAETCGGYTAAQLQEMKDQQRAVSVQRGASEAEFGAGFDAGYAEGSAKLKQSSAQDREKACAQARQIQQMGAGMQQR